MDAEKIEVMLNEQMSGVRSNLMKDAIEVAVLTGEILRADSTLFFFRDLAGQQFQEGDNRLMTRYKEYRRILISMVEELKNKSVKDITNQLKCLV